MQELIPTQRKLAHVRSLGQGDPLWSGATRYAIPGQSPTVSHYDVRDQAVDDQEAQYELRGGVLTGHRRSAVREPTMTRRQRTGAFVDSTPAAVFFQGYFATHWGDIAGARARPAAKALTQNYNPSPWGSKELHPATVYNPWPSMGALEMKAV